MEKTNARVFWPAVIVFYVVACAIAWPFFWWRDLHPVAWEAWRIPASAKALLPALGPGLGAVIALVVFRHRHRRTVSLAGTSWVRSLSFLALPALLVTVIGVGDQQPHLTALFYVEVHVVYALTEELGWRGFLQDALAPLPPRVRYLLIGVMWGVWHFTGFAYGGVAIAALRLLMMFAFWILGSWGIGRAVERTRSLIVAASIHLVFDFGQHLTLKRATFAAFVSVLVWLAMLRVWPAPEEGAGEATDPR